MSENNQDKGSRKPKKPTALKRTIQNEKKHRENRSFKSAVRTAINGFESAASEENLQKIYSLMDKGVKKGIYKKNKAARVKSRYATKAKA